MLFWISHVGDQAAAAATSSEASELRLAPMVERAAPPAAPHVAAVEPMADQRDRAGEPPQAAAARAPVAARPPVTTPATRPIAQRSTTQPRPAPARTPVAPRRGAKVDLDGTFEAYQ